VVSVDERLRAAANELRVANAVLPVPQSAPRPRRPRWLVLGPAAVLTVALIAGILASVLGGNTTNVAVGPPSPSVDQVFAGAAVTSSVSWHGQIVAAGSVRPFDCRVVVGVACGSGAIPAVWSSTASDGWKRVWTAPATQLSTGTLPAGQSASVGPPFQILLDTGKKLYLLSTATLDGTIPALGRPDTLEMWESSNATTWQKVPLPRALAGSPIAAAVYGHDKMVLLARSEFAATVWTSGNGTTWQSTSSGLQSLSPGGGSLAVTPTGYILGLRTKDPQDLPAVWNSPDGTHWTPTTVTSTNGWVSALATRGDVTVALVAANYGTDSFYVTTNGRTWSPAPIPTGIQNTSQLQVVVTSTGFLATNRYNMPLLIAPPAGNPWMAVTPTGIPRTTPFAADTVIEVTKGELVIFGYTPGPGAFDRPWTVALGGYKTSQEPSNSTPTTLPLSSSVFALATPPVGFTGDTVTAFAQTLTHSPTALVITRIDFGDGTVINPPDPGGCHARPVQTPGLVNSIEVSHTYAQAGDHTIQIWSRMGCGANQSMEYSTTTNYSFAAAPAKAKSWPRCQPTQLAASVTDLGAAAGNVGIEVVLRNTSTRSCSLEGYPGLQLLNASGVALPTTVSRSPSQLFGTVSPHLVGLAPGQSASFDLGYGDNPTGNPPPPYQQACPTATQLSIIPPGVTTALRAATSIAPCEGFLTTSPVVPGTTRIPSQ
jgi:hypothetical protein